MRAGSVFFNPVTNIKIGRGDEANIVLTSVSHVNLYDRFVHKPASQGDILFVIIILVRYVIYNKCDNVNVSNPI